MQKKVSIIITAYNYAQYLPFALDSALNQTYDNFEVIVVNDGSTDNTDDVCKDYINRYADKLRYISQPNQGLVGARRTGIDASTGEYIMCLDADDEIDREYVSTCAALLDSGNDIACTWWIEFQDNPENGVDFMHKIDEAHLTYQDFVIANRIIVASMFTRKMYDLVGGYDPNMYLGYEDYELWRNMVKHGAKIGVSHKVLYFYRKHGTSMVTRAVQHHKELMDYMAKKEGLIK